MNLLDWIIIGVMGFFIIRGVFRGFVMETASLTGVILGIWMASLYQPEMTGRLKGYLPAGNLVPLIGFCITFALVFLVCNLAGWVFKILINRSRFGCLDRGMGAGLATLKGIVIIYFAAVLLTFYLPSKTPLIAQSRLTPLIVRSYQSIVSLISPGSYQRWKEKFTGAGKDIGRIVKEKVRDISGEDGS
jgi:membrane protein required for colicin V production